MRGVAGLELEILRAKARGDLLRIPFGTPEAEIVQELRDRGLLRIAHYTEDLGRTNEITQMGRVVLAASLP